LKIIVVKEEESQAGTAQEEIQTDLQEETSGLELPSIRQSTLQHAMHAVKNVKFLSDQLQESLFIAMTVSEITKIKDQEIIFLQEA